MTTSSTTLTMAEQLVPDEIGAAIQPLLPAKRPHPKGGRPWIEDRAVLGGIIYVLRAGVPWRLLPARELGCGSGVTCWRQLRDWQQAGVWEQLHHRPGRPRKRPAKLHADKGHDYTTCRRTLRRRNITPRIARRGMESSQRLGRHRWKVERSLAWLLANRRLTVRYGRRADILTAFLHLACALLSARRLNALPQS